VVDESKLIRDVPKIAKLIDPNTGAVSTRSQRLLDSLFDNDSRTYTELTYQGRGENAYLEFDFGPTKHIRLADVELLARPGNRERIGGAIVDGSHDGTTWTPLTQGADKTEDWQHLRMKPSAEFYRYLRIINRSAWFCNASEVRFHGELK
jgi:F5/8 type C domain